MKLFLMILFFSSSASPAATATVPYPMKLSAVETIDKEARRLIRFLKRGFLGVTTSNYGPIVGIELSQLGIRIWGGLNQGRTMDLKKDYELNARVNTLNGHRVGFGVRLKGDLNLDLEYQTIDGGQSERNNAYIMSLSVPISL